MDRPTPVILTTSQLLTTGVDAELVKNVVLARVVGARAEFKQIVGRGTRLKVVYGKEYFNIIDFTGTATRHFADPAFDGDSFAELAAASAQPDADPFDLLCHLAWNAPLYTRRQRADRARRQAQDLFAQHGDTAREILALLLDRYIERGILQFNTLSELMKVQPFDRLQAEVTALRAEHTAIRQANAALLPATLERVFTGPAAHRQPD